MDVSKIFSRSPEQGEVVPTVQTSPTVVKKQKTPPEIVKEYLDEEFEDPNENLVSEIETQIRAAPEQYFAITTAYIPRHPLSQRFHELLKEIGELHDKKQKDYGTADDPFANVRGATEFGLPAAMGAFIAMSDIMTRIKSWCKNGSVENDTIEDSLKDMAVYSLIAYVLLEEEQEANGN